MNRIKQLAPEQCREIIASNHYQGPTAGIARGYLQANLVILPSRVADDFLDFARLNAKPCPLLEILPAGIQSIEKVASANVATDFPMYRVFRNGVEPIECPSILDIWQDDWVSFLIGCSYTTDQLLEDNGMVLQHVQHNTTVAIYETSLKTKATEYFSGPLAVSMRAIKADEVDLAIAITQDYPLAHGAPVHYGDPSLIGIKDITQPVFGEYYPLEEDEVPVFWACGITPQLCADRAKISIMITHKPGHLLICDFFNHELFQKDKEL